MYLLSDYSGYLSPSNVGTIYKEHMRPIFEYLSYRQYLSDYYAEKKKNSSVFSYRYFADRAGIRSPALFREVVTGRRNLSHQMIDKFSGALQLNERERRYFRYLVLFNQAQTGTQKQEYYAVLRSMMDQVNESNVDSHLFEYFSKWYHPVVRELVCLGDFQNDYDMIARTLMPPITRVQARRAVELLKELELIIELPDGTYKQHEPAVTVSSDLGTTVIREFNASMLDLARKSISDQSPDVRHVSGVTLNCCKELYDALNVEIDAFKQRIIMMANNAAKESDLVYQLNIQLFRVSKAVEKPVSED